MAKVLLESVHHPGRTRRFAPREARVLVRLGRWRYATRDVPDAPVQKTSEPEHRDPFAGVDFASDVAYEAARAAGLTSAAFEERTGSGRNGSFTKADVYEIVKDWA